MAITVPQPNTPISAETFGQPVAVALNALDYLPWADYVPTLAQGSATNIGKTLIVARWQRLNKTVDVKFNMTATGAGVAGQGVTISLPVAAFKSDSNITLGHGLIYNGTIYTGCWDNQAGNLSVGLSADGGAGGWGSVPNVALKAGDILRGTLRYEVA